MLRQRALCLPTVLLAIILIPALPAQTGIINTVAGTGVSGTGGVGGLAVNAQLSGAGGIGLDYADNVYIADSPYHRVLRVDAASGILTVVAGNGAAASNGDNGPATQASVYTPYGVALDAGGNLLIVEFQGHRVRRVDAQTGIITTIAGNGTPGFSGDGGPAVSASLQYPEAISLDVAGNLYIADAGNARVRRVDALTGVITTVVGNGTSGVSPDGVTALNASLSAPFGVSVDRVGNLLISEPGSARIRRVDAATGVLGTAAGNGTADFTGDALPATSAGIGKIGGNVAIDLAGDLFFPDGTGRIRRVDAGTGLITTVAGNGTGAQAQASGGGGTGCSSEPLGDNGPATNATLDGAFSVALTSNGNLIFSDWLDCRVRRVSLPSPYPYTKVSLSLSASTVPASQPVTFTATVIPVGASGSPTGTIQFVDQLPSLGSTLIGTAQLTNGTASLTVSTPPNAGTHRIVAYYDGDPSFNGSGSPAAPLTVSYGTLAVVTLSSSQNPVTLNTSITFTATVKPPAGSATQPTGWVEFDDGASKLGTASLVNGVAQLSVSFSTSGTHAIFAPYLGDINYTQVRSATLSESVNPAPTTTSLASSAASVSYGQPVQLTATVSPNSASGTVNFLDMNPTVGGVYDSSPVLGTAALTGGTAMVTLSNLAAGTHAIEASYLGDSGHAASKSGPISLSVAQATPVLVMSSWQDFEQSGPAVTFAGSVTPVSQAGTLNILDGQSPITETITSSPGQFTVTTAGLTPGTHSITTAGGDRILTQRLSPKLLQGPGQNRRSAGPSYVSVTRVHRKCSYGGDSCSQDLHRSGPLRSRRQLKRPQPRNGSHVLRRARASPGRISSRAKKPPRGRRRRKPPRRSPARIDVKSPNGGLRAIAAARTSQGSVGRDAAK